MKITNTTLTLLHLLQLSSAATLPRAKPLTDPHFPSHQLSSTSSPSARDSLFFDNTPITPSANVLPSHALAAPIPLESSYLQSLANPATHPPCRDPVAGAKEKSGSAAELALPAKPTSALPDLREEDGRRYWAIMKGQKEKHTGMGLKKDEVKKVKEVVAFSRGILRTVRLCPEQRGFTSRLYSGNTLTMAREYSDALVVAIVLLFLILVVVLEVPEKCASVRFRQNRTLRRGKIYLSDDTVSLYIVRKPTFLQPAPKGRYQSSKHIAKKQSMYDVDSGSDTAVEEGFDYDGDAYEKV